MLKYLWLEVSLPASVAESLRAFVLERSAGKQRLDVLFEPYRGMYGGWIVRWSFLSSLFSRTGVGGRSYNKTQRLSQGARVGEVKTYRWARGR